MFGILEIFIPNITKFNYFLFYSNLKVKKEEQLIKKVIFLNKN